MVKNIDFGSLKKHTFTSTAGHLGVGPNQIGSIKADTVAFPGAAKKLPSRPRLPEAWMSADSIPKGRTDQPQHEETTSASRLSVTTNRTPRKTHHRKGSSVSSRKSLPGGNSPFEKMASIHPAQGSRRSSLDPAHQRKSSGGSGGPEDVFGPVSVSVRSGKSGASR